MTWQIQARLKGGTEWEPISVERRNHATTERRFNYDTLEDAKAAFERFDSIDNGFPNMIARATTGRPRLTEAYEVRFVNIEVERGECPDCRHIHNYDHICGALRSDREPGEDWFCHCQRPEGFVDPEPDALSDQHGAEPAGSAK